MACHPKNQPTVLEAPHWTAAPSHVSAAPAWTVYSPSEYPSSMTITTEVPTTSPTNNDRIAAILLNDDIVIGADRYYGGDNISLYMHGLLEENTYPVYRLCYYSADEQQFYVTYDEKGLVFENDLILGTEDNPAVFHWIACGAHTLVQHVKVYKLGNSIHADDEWALFINGVCRQTYSYEVTQEDGTPVAKMWLPHNEDEVEGTCLYYHSQEHTIDTVKFPIANNIPIELFFN